MAGVIRTDSKVSAGPGYLTCAVSQQYAKCFPVACRNMSHVLGKRHRVHRDLRMIVLSEYGRCFQTDRAITQRSSLRTTSYDSDMLSHASSLAKILSRNIQVGFNSEYLEVIRRNQLFSRAREDS